MCKVKPILLSGLVLFSCGLFAQSPGGVSQQIFWLQGNTSPDVARPKAALNFNPAIDLTNIQDHIKLPGSIHSLRKATIFTVYQQPVTDKETEVWEIAGRFGDLQLSTKQVSSKAGNAALEFANTHPAIIHTYVGRLKKSADDANNKQASLRLGQPNAQVMMPEFILYDKILSEAEITKIETYLALKYGITLKKNYVNASGDVVWNYKLDSNYSNDLAGIARDDQAALYQKQTTSSNAPAQLVIGMDNIASSNYENAGKAEDKSFLIFGHNAQNFAPGNATTADITLFDRKWLMKRSGNSADKIATELKIDVNAVSSTDDLYLIIDRSGTAEFAAENCTHIKGNISPEGIATFKDLYWDTDGSGKDAFTFGFKLLKRKLTTESATVLSFQLYPNPVRDKQFKMAVTLDKPADIQVRIYDINQRLVHSSKASGQSYYLLPASINGAAGAYTIRVTTPQTEYSRIIVVQ